jgi:hypothetical protein
LHIFVFANFPPPQLLIATLYLSNYFVFYVKFNLILSDSFFSL